MVGVNTQLTVRLSGIRPKNVEHNLRLVVLHLVHHLKRSIYLLNVLKSVQRGSDTAVQTEDLVLDESSQRQPVKQFVYAGEHRILTFRLLLDFLCTFIPEAKINVYLTVLVIATNEVHLLRVDAFKC